MSESYHNWNEASHDLEEESDPSASSTILLRVRRRGAFTEASSTLRLELDAALAAAHAMDDWDIHSSSADLLVDDDEDNADASSSNKNYDNGIDSTTTQYRRHSQSLTTSTVPTTAIFRRIDSTSIVSRIDDDESFCYNHNNIRSSISSTTGTDYLKRTRILDAVLLEEENVTDEETSYDHQQLNGQEQQHHHTKKRRRLTLQIIDTSQQQHQVTTGTVQNLQQRRRNSSLAKSRKNISYPILTPEQRMIDDSLHQVFSGTQSLQQHYQLMESITTTTTSSSSSIRNRTSSTSNISTPGWLWPYMWCHKEYGNWLHVAAIWNEAILVKEILTILDERIQVTCVSKSQHQPHSPQQQQSMMIYHMLQSWNQEGLSPMDVAQLSGNHEVLLILEHFGSNVKQQQQNNYTTTTSSSNYDSKCDDIDHEQYDLYSLVVVKNKRKKSIIDRTTSTTIIPTQHQSDHESTAQLDIEDEQYITDCELHNNCRGYWDERGNLILAPTTNNDLEHFIANTSTNNNNDNDNDDDIDSNDEEWDGNDYPDIEEELDDDPCLDDEDDDDNSSEYNHTFRHRSANPYRHPVNKDDDDDDDEIDAHYDPSYGDLYGQSDSLYN
jgi:hypothetical protein